MAGRPTGRREQMADPLLQNGVGRQPDGVLEPLRLEKRVDLRHGEGGIGLAAGIWTDNGCFVKTSGDGEELGVPGYFVTAIAGGNMLNLTRPVAYAADGSHLYAAYAYGKPVVSTAERFCITGAAQKYVTAGSGWRQHEGDPRGVPFMLSASTEGGVSR